MEKLMCWIVILTFSLSPVLTHANRITPLKRGSPAPYTGVLLDTEAMVRIKQDKKYQQKVCKLEKNTIKQRNSNELRYKVGMCKNELKSARSKFNSIIAVKDREIKRLRVLIKPKTDLTLVWVGIGFVVGVAATIGIMFAVKPQFNVTK